MSLEQKVEDGGILKRFRKAMERYATIATAAVAIAGSVYMSGCSDDVSDCCAQLACEEKDDAFNRYYCSDVSENDPTYKSHLCIKNEKAGEYGEPTNFCCRCIAETKSYDKY